MKLDWNAIVVSAIVCVVARWATSRLTEDAKLHQTRAIISVSPSGTLRIEAYQSSGVDSSYIDLLSVGGDAKKIRDVHFPGVVRDACVTDTGDIIAIGLSEAPSQVIMAVCSANFGDKLLIRQGRMPSREIHAPPHPGAEGVMLDRSRKIAVFRVGETKSGRTDETWVFVKPETGDLLDVLKPRDHLTPPSRIGSVLTTFPVGDTGAFFVQWCRFHGDETDLGTKVTGIVYSVVECKKGVIWQLDSRDALPSSVVGDFAQIQHDYAAQADGVGGFIIDPRSTGPQSYSVTRFGESLKIVRSR